MDSLKFNYGKFKTSENARRRLVSKMRVKYACCRTARGSSWWLHEPQVKQLNRTDYETDIIKRNEIFILEVGRVEERRFSRRIGVIQLKSI